MERVKYTTFSKLALIPSSSHWFFFTERNRKTWKSPDATRGI
jgi:hypothetical protein